jgi:hypothetical protein
VAGIFAAGLRDLREANPTPLPDSVPDDWHPFDLRDKPAEPDAAAVAPPFSASALIDAHRRRGEPSNPD